MFWNRDVKDTSIIQRKCVGQYWRELHEKSRRSEDRRLTRIQLLLNSSTYAAAADTPATNGSRYLLRTGFCSLATALASICRTRSRVTLKIRPTSSSV